MLTEQDVTIAQENISDKDIIQTISKNYPHLYYVAIFANNNFENTTSKELQTLFYISQDDTKGANWILQVVEWLIKSPFVAQENKNGILAMDLHQLNLTRLHTLFLNLNSLKDSSVNVEVTNFLYLLKLGYKEHYYLRMGQ